MFSQPGRVTKVQEKYPFVFDAYAEAKQTSSFIGGSKVLVSLCVCVFFFIENTLFQMMLPIGFERENNKEYEEVNIPPSDPSPVHIGKTLVPISQLDEV
jgi:activating signal cointegrator complex subunit 3